MQHYGGIDWSGAKEPLSNLWSAVGVEHDGRLHVLSLRPHPFRRDLQDYVIGGWRDEIGAPAEAPCLWGADFPFGIPLAAAEALAGQADGWRSVAAALASEEPAALAESIKPFAKTLRQHDVASALAPLDLRLHKQTLAGLRWLLELADEQEADLRPISRKPAATTTLIEVYPSITRTDLSLKAPRKPRRPGEVRARPAALRDLVSFAHPSLQAAAVTLEDAWDATLACLTAYLVREDLDQPARLAPQAQATWSCEGWIYRHPQAAGA
jgi:hypothetical protein